MEDEYVYTSDEQRREALVQSAFIDRLTDPFMEMNMPGRPPIATIKGAATVVLSVTEDGSPHLDLATSKEEILEGIKDALDSGVTVSPWLLSLNEKRKLEVAEAELERMQDVVYRARKAADEALLYAEQYLQGASPGQIEELAIIR